MLGQLNQRRRQARDGGGQWSVERQRGLYLAVAAIHVLVGLEWCALAGIKELIANRLSALPQQEEPATAQP